MVTWTLSVSEGKESHSVISELQYGQRPCSMILKFTLKETTKDRGGNLFYLVSFQINFLNWSIETRRKCTRDFVPRTIELCNGAKLPRSTKNSSGCVAVDCSSEFVVVEHQLFHAFLQCKGGWTRLVQDHFFWCWKLSQKMGHISTDAVV